CWVVLWAEPRLLREQLLDRPCFARHRLGQQTEFRGVLVWRFDPVEPRLGRRPRRRGPVAVAAGAVLWVESLHLAEPPRSASTRNAETRQGRRMGWKDSLERHSRTWLGAAVLWGLLLRLYHFLRVPAVWQDEAAVLVNVL